MLRIRFVGVSFVALLLGALSTISGQVAGRISGSVVDASGAAVPNAKVSFFLQGGSSALLSTQTTSDGLISISTVRPEFYDVVVEAPGFEKTKLPGVKVDPSKETSLPPITLQISATTTAIEVVEHTAAVQTSNAEVAVTISRTQVDNLPVLDRQVNFLFNTQAGVTSARTATTVNGLRPSYTNLLLDGINVQDSVRTNRLDYVPNRLTIGQIADITLATANANPTIGGNANTISLTTPSGTNEFHGNAYWYNRNSYFGANDWFNNQSGIEKPFLNLNQLGALDRRTGDQRQAVLLRELRSLPVTPDDADAAGDSDSRGKAGSLPLSERGRAGTKLQRDDQPANAPRPLRAGVVAAGADTGQLHRLG